MLPSSAVIELVEIPLAVSFEQFWSLFELELEPVLLAQPGLISVFTGMMLEKRSGIDYAVSITQWESMEAHERFVKSASAGPFFEKQKPLTGGPPTISHYAPAFPPREASRSGVTRLEKFKTSQTQRDVAELRNTLQHISSPDYHAVGRCLEDPDQAILITFGGPSPVHVAPEQRGLLHTIETFQVRWYSKQTSRLAAAL